jgi:hypothetical protein
MASIPTEEAGHAEVSALLDARAEGREPGEPGVALSTDLRDPNAIPYFLWDDPMTVREVHQLLATASPPERDRLLGKILREARDSDVWCFTTPAEVARRFDALSRHLGRRRRFWEFLLAAWQEQGLLGR